MRRFRIRGKDEGISRIGGRGFRDDSHQIHLADIHFRHNGRFRYEDDFGDLWRPVIWVQRQLAEDDTRLYPVCIGGQRAALPEDCWGPLAFMALQDKYAPGYFLDRDTDLVVLVRLPSWVVSDT